MIDQHKPAAQGERKYYSLEVDFDVSNKSSPHQWVNEKQQFRGFFPRPDEPFRGLHFSEPPRIKFEHRRGRVLRDAGPVTLGIWLISDRLKKLLDRLDPNAFVFQQVEVDYSEFPTAGPDFWFVYVMRTLDCVDEERSIIRYQDTPDIKAYAALIDVRMRPETVGTAHAFRLTYARSKLIVDDVIVAALKADNIRGFRFEPIKK